MDAEAIARLIAAEFSGEIPDLDGTTEALLAQPRLREKVTRGAVWEAVLGHTAELAVIAQFLITVAFETRRQLLPGRSSAEVKRAVQDAVPMPPELDAETGGRMVQQTIETASK